MEMVKKQTDQKINLAVDHRQKFQGWGLSVDRSVLRYSDWIRVLVS